MSKKSIIISNYDSLENTFYAGGGAIAVHEVAKRLLKHYSVTVVCGLFPGCPTQKISDGVEYRFIGSKVRQPQLSQLAYQTQLPSLIIKLTKKNAFNLWIESFTPPFSTSCLQIFTKKPVVALAHMLSGQDMARKYHCGVFTFLERLGLRTYRNIIVTSKEMGCQVAQKNPKAHLYEIPNGVSAPSRITPLRQTKKIVFIGRLEIDQKGLDLLIDSFSQIPSVFDPKLMIAGQGNDQQKKTLLNLISKHNLNSQVSVLGAVSGKKKENLLKSANVVVVPSRFETYSLVALEAMSFARPLVVFNITGLKWIPSQAVIRVPPFDTSKYSQALLKVLTNQRLARSMGYSGAKFSKQLSWSKVAQSYRSVIESQLSVI